MSSADRPSLNVAVLYPDLLNLYGDRGNARTLEQRCAARSIEANVIGVGIGDDWSSEEADIVLVGGGQDREQRRVQADLQQRGEDLRKYVDNDGVVLAVCGGFQLFGHHYRGWDGEIMEGIGVFDAVATHPGPRIARCVGNVIALWEGETVVGFENHGGRTYLNEGQQALADVVSGFGNNGGDGLEGAKVKNAYGTYLHGAVLPKNPRLADRLISLAMVRRYGPEEANLAPLDDSAALRAHAEALHAALSAGESSLGRRFA
ncbi:MAG: glutamine amidotransferase [Chloroflexota bacterium]|nr:glutamine amidotransferase [Chloroflexota bacterium]